MPVLSFVEGRRLAAIALTLAGACARDFSVVPAQFGTLRGRVVSAGEPRAGAQVKLQKTTLATVTLDDGSWTLRRVPLGRYDLFAGVDADQDGVFELSGGAPGIELLAGGEDVTVPDVDLQPAASIAGRVTSGAQVRPGAMVFLPGTHRLAFTDAEGLYLLAGVPPGRSEVGASAPGFVPQLAVLALAPGEARAGVDFDLAPAGDADRASFTGAVRWTDQPAAQGWAAVQAFEGPTLRGETETAGGKFRLGPLAPAVYALRLDAPGYRTLTLPLMPLGAADQEVGEVWLEPGVPEPAGPDPTSPEGEVPASLTSPRRLMATPGDGRVTLSWDAPESGADGYQVWRGASDAASAAVVLNAGGLVVDRVFTDSTVANYRRYFYRVTARLRGRDSPLAESPLATAVPGPGTVLAGAAGTRKLTTAGNPHTVVGADLVVLAGETLTIEPGVELRFGSGLRLLVQGALVARGSASQPVIFTQLDTGGWKGIVFEGSSVDAVTDGAGDYLAGSILEHAVVERSTDSGVTILTSSPLLLRTEVRYNNDYQSATVSFGGGIHVGPGAAPVIRACNIHHNSAGITEDDSTNYQWGAGIYSEGSPILWENEIAYNELKGGLGANSTSWGGGVFLRSGQAILSRNRIAATLATGTSQSNTGQVLRTRGLGIHIDTGAHFIANNVLENNSTSHNPGDNRGTLYVASGAHVVVRNRISGNRIGDTSTGGAIYVDQGVVRAFLNVLASNVLTGGQLGTAGSAIATEDTQSIFRFNDFVANSPVKYEVANTGNMVLDLRSNYFSQDAASTPVSARIYRPSFANFEDARSEPIPGAGPQPCLGDEDCAALGGAQRCFYTGCVPACLLRGCGPTQSCDPISGACGP